MVLSCSYGSYSSIKYVLVYFPKIKKYFSLKKKELKKAS